jgi:tetratricopeptide (TPR) repeat protein
MDNNSVPLGREKSMQLKDIGNQHYKAGDYKKAIEFFTKAIVRVPQTFQS